MSISKVISFFYLLLFFVTPIIFLPWSSELFEFNKLTLTYIISIFIVTLYTILCLQERKLIFKKTPLDIPILIFLFINLTSLLFSIDPQTSWLGYYGRWNGGLLSLITYSLLYWIYVSTQNSLTSIKHIRTLIITTTLVASYGILEHFGIDSHLWVQDVQTRVFSTLGQPNWLAAFLMCVIYIPVVFFAKSKSRPNYLAWLSIFSAIFLCLLYTKSRSGLLAFGFSTIVFSLTAFFSWGITLSSEIKSLLLKIGFIFSTIVLLLIFITPNPIKELVIKSKSTPAPTGPALEQGGTESGTIRKIVWSGAINAWLESPKSILIGSGPETFAMIYYKFRPIAHNNTSEWELLYNKAHNEYLNYLTTIGVVGLTAYLILLFSIIITFKRNISASDDKLVHIALMSGWTSLLVTNFWGFSVVIVQILLFLLPAISVSLSNNSTPISSPKSSSFKLIFILVCLPGIFLLYSTGKYWLADYYYGSSQKFENQFHQTEDTESLIRAYTDISTAHTLNPNEPFINTQLAGVSGYLSILTAQLDATSSASLATLAADAANQALYLSPAHPVHYKSAARTFILLSAYEAKYLETANQILKKAEELSPTDPRLPYNRAVIAKYNQNPQEALELFKAALLLKPDFPDAKLQYEILATQSAQMQK